MRNKFIRTANFIYINLAFVKSIYYRKKTYKDLDFPLFEIILECIEGEVSFGHVFTDDAVFDIMENILNNETIINEYFTEEEGLRLLNKGFKIGNKNG